MMVPLVREVQSRAARIKYTPVTPRITERHAQSIFFFFRLTNYVTKHAAQQQTGCQLAVAAAGVAMAATAVVVLAAVVLAAASGLGVVASPPLGCGTKIKSLKGSATMPMCRTVRLCTVRPQ